ncbi:uncharacterized protein BJ171DRAFT_585503 [Polychytrium aggregatum]|uniref:uncharacterized protein n=1 Tax=Polychytrium aggregatum TaxID=110093 RepID=UPI0022FF2FDB|nr:uncharacterized protein BJ171DRAFT_585503 [Polychytrium aggregatum]KAI9199263.1 hypothetical protein BJ171DRAFT_585503 [Polychytrium aggregatum]
MDTVSYMRSLHPVRERSSLILSNPQYLQHFDLNLAALDTVVDQILELIRRDYENLSEIPPHSRWRHFEANNIKRIDPILADWDQRSVPAIEQTRRVLDLFIVSVLLDAGAGDRYKYHPKAEPGISYTRSEALALASLDMFLAGGFSSDPKQPLQVDSLGLAQVTTQMLANHLQVSDSNPLNALENRCELLHSLGRVIAGSNPFFPITSGVARPGNLIDYLVQHPSTQNGRVQMAVLWDCIGNGLCHIWPSSRTTLDGVPLGDVWKLQSLDLAMKQPNSHGTVCSDPKSAGLAAFHKLSQWLAYSCLEPIEVIMKLQIEGIELLTGLAEYRNGGLFVDSGVLSLKPGRDGTVIKGGNGVPPRFRVDDDVVVEWRALTVALLDRVAEKVRHRLGADKHTLPLAKVLEAGTWKAGREIAAKLRPLTKGPPIEIESDGTVF